MHGEAEYRVSLFEMVKAHKETFLVLCFGVIFCARSKGDGGSEKSPSCGLRVRQSWKSRRQVAYIDLAQKFQAKEVKCIRLIAEYYFHSTRHRRLIELLR